MPESKTCSAKDSPGEVGGCGCESEEGELTLEAAVVEAAAVEGGGVGGCGWESVEGEPILEAAAVLGGGVGGCGCDSEEGELILGAAAVQGGGDYKTAAESPQLY